jgi:glycyl-tRNA synthetase beta chain
LNKGFRYDLVQAGLSAGIDNINFSFLRVKALETLKSSPQFEPLILMAKRVNNICRKITFLIVIIIEDARK